MGAAPGLRGSGGVIVTFTNHFSVVDDAIGPQPWMQLRLVGSVEADSVSKNYDPNDGQAKNDLLQTMRTSWTNNSPVTQYVYGMVSKSGSQVTLQSRSRGYLTTGHGVTVGAAGAAVTTVEVSRFGVGTDLGNGGILGLGGEFGISELRQNSTTIPLLPNLTGWFIVAPGETFNAAVEVRFVSENWEATIISGGDADTESKVITGDVRVDLFAVPAVVAPGARNQPSIVGGSANVRSAVTNTVNTVVTSPTGLGSGDILVAITANSYGFANSSAPVESGWTLLHSRSETELFGITNGLNFRVYVRRLTGAPAASYGFTNGAASEQVAVLLGLRSVTPPDSVDGMSWYVSSNLSRNGFFNRDRQQIAPTINKSGQLLLALSYYSHPIWRAPLTQTAPAGMTKIADFTGGVGALCLAVLNSPPSPTGDRVFTPSTQEIEPLGYSVAASILVPGSRS